MNEIIGYRGFMYAPSAINVRLQGVRVEWATDTLVATCQLTKTTLRECHESEYAGHTTANIVGGTEYRQVSPECGIYSFKSLIDVLNMNTQWNVVAEVENFGDLVVEHETGYRSSATRIRRLWYLPPNAAEPAAIVSATRALAIQFGCPVEATDWSHLLSPVEYEKWVGIEQVDATRDALTKTTFSADLYALSQFLGGKTWLTLGSQSANTSTSQTLASWSALSSQPPVSQWYPLLYPKPSLSERILEHAGWVFVGLYAAGVALVVGSRWLT
jgi:hypothetical protein